MKLLHFPDRVLWYRTSRWSTAGSPMRLRASKGARRPIRPISPSNPLDRVPALVTATHGTITEVPAVLSFVADVATGRGLLPAIGTQEPYLQPATRSRSPVAHKLVAL
jgi:hypothetical protein